MIKWSDEYLLGVEELDLQHRRLLEIAAEAESLLKTSLRTDKYDAIVGILEELKAYTVAHFQAEEKYMASIGHKKLLSHKVQHNDFVQRIQEIDLSAVDANQDRYLLELLDFVAAWIVDHILVTDRLYIAGN